MQPGFFAAKISELIESGCEVTVLVQVSFESSDQPHRRWMRVTSIEAAEDGGYKCKLFAYGAMHFDEGTKFMIRAV